MTYVTVDRVARVLAEAVIYRSTLPPWEQRLRRESVWRTLSADQQSGIKKLVREHLNKKGMLA